MITAHAVSSISQGKMKLFPSGNIHIKFMDFFPLNDRAFLNIPFFFISNRNWIHAR